MPKFFKKTPKKGMPISLIGLADGLAAIEKALKTLSCRGGDVSWNFGRPEIVPCGSDGEITDIPDGTYDRDVIVWDTTTSAYVVERYPVLVPDGAVERDVLTWDFSADEWVTESYPISDGTSSRDILVWNTTTGKYDSEAMPLPDGTTLGDTIVWDATVSGKWVREAKAASVVPDGTVTGQFLRWNGTAWVTAALTQITCITDFQNDTSGHKLQVKTRTGYVYAPGTESEWTDLTSSEDTIEGVSA